MSKQDISTVILESLQEVLNQEFQLSDVLADRIDSLQALEILVLIEKKLDIEVLDDDLFEKGAWDSVENLVQYFEDYVKHQKV